MSLLERALKLFLCSVFVLFLVPLHPSQAKLPLARFARGAAVKLEVASSPEEISRGLMYRTSLPADCGMIFLFRPARAINFWMYHTLIPLDMLFIHDGKIVELIENVPPCKSENPHECPQYPGGAGVVVSEVIEVNAGYARRHRLKEGDAVTFKLP